MIKKLYEKYFQKSRSFLYPILGIKKDKFTPSATYISIEGIINPEDIKLICVFKKDESENFKNFEKSIIISSSLFQKKINIEDYNIYVFDLQVYESDYFSFLLGKYSKLSPNIKRAIKNYYGESSAEYKVIDTYLFPEKYFEVYAKLLNVDVEILKATGELCDVCDLSKETLKISIENLEVSNKI